MAELLDNDGTCAEAGLLGIMANELQTLGLVLNDIGSNGWMVRNLFDKKIDTATTMGVRPGAVE